MQPKGSPNPIGKVRPHKLSRSVELIIERPIFPDTAIKGLIDHCIVTALLKLYMREMMTNAPKSKARFVEPVLLRRKDKLPEGLSGEIRAEACSAAELGSPNPTGPI